MITLRNTPKDLSWKFPLSSERICNLHFRLFLSQTKSSYLNEYFGSLISKSTDDSVRFVRFSGKIISSKNSHYCHNVHQTYESTKSFTLFLSLLNYVLKEVRRKSIQFTRTCLVSKQYLKLLLILMHSQQNERKLYVRRNKTCNFLFLKKLEIVPTTQYYSTWEKNHNKSFANILFRSKGKQHRYE